MTEGDTGGFKFLRKPWFYAIACLVLVAAGAAIYVAFFVSRDPIPQNIRSQVHFTLFYPKPMPPGWSVDRTSFYADTSVQVVGYRLRGPHGNLAVTIQPVPQGFNFNEFYTKRLSDTVQFLTPLGQGAIGKAGGQTVGSLQSTTSWALTYTNSPIMTSSDVQTVLNSLHPVSP